MHALFDLGVIHSFVSQQFVSKLGVESIKLHCELVVATLSSISMCFLCAEVM